MRAPLIKHYMTRRQSRALALDHPIGDPFGGAAYGEYREPVTATAIFAAVVEAAPVITAIGAAMSVVGVVTGDKTLTSMGGVMGLAGGVSMIGGAAGWFGEAAAEGLASADVGTTVANETADQIAAAPGEGVINEAQSVGMQQPPETAVAGVSSEGPSMANIVKNDALAPLADTAAPATAPPPTQAPATGAPENWGMDKGVINGNVADNSGLNKALNVGGGAGSAAGLGVTDPDSIWGMFSKASAWAEKNPITTMGGLAMLGKGVGAMFDKSIPAKIRESESKSSYYDAEANKLATQTQYGNQVPDITGQVGVNPNANIFAARKPLPSTFGMRGIVNSARTA